MKTACGTNIKYDNTLITINISEDKLDILGFDVDYLKEKLIKLFNVNEKQINIKIVDMDNYSIKFIGIIKELLAINNIKAIDFPDEKTRIKIVKFVNNYMLVNEVNDEYFSDYVKFVYANYKSFLNSKRQTFRVSVFIGFIVSPYVFNDYLNRNAIQIKENKAAGIRSKIRTSLFED